jgi:hypothetical protein
LDFCNTIRGEAVCCFWQQEQHKRSVVPQEPMRFSIAFHRITVMVAPAKFHDRNSSEHKHISGKGHIATTLPTSLASVVVQQPPSSGAIRAHCAR